MLEKLEDLKLIEEELFVEIQGVGTPKSYLLTFKLTHRKTKGKFSEIIKFYELDKEKIYCKTFFLEFQS